MVDLKTYEDVGFNNLLSKKRPVVTEIDSGFTIKNPQVSSKNLVRSIEQKIIIAGVEESIQFAPIQSPYAYSTLYYDDIPLNNGDQGILTSTITSKKDSNIPMFGIFEISAYETSISTANLIPYSHGLDEYSLYSNYSYHKLRDNPQTSKSALCHRFQILNNSGDTQSIHLLYRWRFLGATDFSEA